MKTKGCPFCGCKGRVVPVRTKQDRISGYFVNCSNNKCPMYVTTPVKRTKEEAIAIWNNRWMT